MKPKHKRLWLLLGSLGALAVIFFFFVFIGAIWAFLEPLGTQYGIDSQAIGVLVSASLAMQVLGAAMATWLEARLDYRVALVGVGIVAITAAAILGSGPTPAMFPEGTDVGARFAVLYDPDDPERNAPYRPSSMYRIRPPA